MTTFAISTFSRATFSIVLDSWIVRGKSAGENHMLEGKKWRKLRIGSDKFRVSRVSRYISRTELTNESSWSLQG